MSTDQIPTIPDEQVAFFREKVETGLQKIALPTQPALLYEPVRYILQSKGKRMRPVLLLLAYQMFGKQWQVALPAALGVEVFHNFTLVHDDIMDKAPERRGRPTVHTRWDEATAILCGDFLVGLSYELVDASRLQGHTEKVGAVYAAMVRRLCEGQAWDTAFESMQQVSVADYLNMIDGKTGALLACSLEIGGILAGASKIQTDLLSAAGRDLGRAFQIQDDLLDLMAEDTRWGKAVGGDLMVAKRAYLLLKALELSKGEQHTFFNQIIEQEGLPQDKIPEARERMLHLGVIDDAKKQVFYYTDQATAHLNSLPDSVARRALIGFADALKKRLH